MIKRLQFERDFEDQGPSRLTYEIASPDRANATVATEDGEAVLYLNEEACKVFAEIFAKLALGTYTQGFHLHVRENFDFDRAEILRISLT